MYTTPALTAQLAREYSRDRLREAEARRVGRTSRIGAQDHRQVVATTTRAVRRSRNTWGRLVSGRTTTA
jgi:hypothetical protein